MLRKQELQVLQGGRSASAAADEAVLSDLAHEVLAPVWALASMGGAMRRTARLTPRERDLLDAVERTTAQVARTLGGVLDLAEVGGLPLDPRACDLGEVCRAAVGELREIGEEGEVAFEDEGDLGGLWDPERLAQAISYLVELALAAGRGRTPVRLRCRGEAGDVVVRIQRDAAPGETQAAALDVHWGADLRAGPEQGFRPALARRIVAQHGGTLARFATRSATTYVVVLPRNR